MSPARRIHETIAPGGMLPPLCACFSQPMFEVASLLSPRLRKRTEPWQLCGDSIKLKAKLQLRISNRDTDYRILSREHELYQVMFPQTAARPLNCTKIGVKSSLQPKGAFPLSNMRILRSPVSLSGSQILPPTKAWSSYSTLWSDISMLIEA